MKIFILIPAYNCEKLLPKVIERILKLNLDLKIIILDDGSKDKTLEVAKKYESNQVLIFKNNINCGYGAVSKKLYEIVKPMKPDFTISMHADLGHRPEDIIKFTNIINEKKIHFDLVLGSRLLYLKKIVYSKNFFKIFNNDERGNMPLIIVLGQLIVTFLQNIILSTKLNSFHDGMRMCSLNTINWILSKNFSNWYDYDMNLLTLASKEKLDIVEIPIKPFYHKEIVTSVPLVKYTIKMLANAIKFRIKY